MKTYRGSGGDESFSGSAASLESRGLSAGFPTSAENKE